MNTGAREHGGSCRRRLGSAPRIEIAAFRASYAPASPAPHATNVDVDKARAWVIADAATRQFKRGVPEGGGCDALYRDVDRQALHVQAAAGDA